MSAIDQLASRAATNTLERPIAALFCVYLAASLLHFAHNAEFIAFYPGMPAWLTRESVYLVWLAIASVGVVGLALTRARQTALGLFVLAAFGLLGLDGLGHYTLALCSEHSLAMNATIWFEAVSGILLAAGCLGSLVRTRGWFRWLGVS
jgi:hypothetical protein